MGEFLLSLLLNFRTRILLPDTPSLKSGEVAACLRIGVRSALFGVGITVANFGRWDTLLSEGGFLYRLLVSRDQQLRGG
jgi:hypothetical protein